MAESIGQIGLDLVVNQNGFNKQMKGITGLAKKAGATLAAAFAVKKLIDFGKQSIELGSDLAEVQNVVDVTFTTMSNKVNEFAKNAATSFGLSETMAKRYTGTFGSMAKAFGFTEKQAYDMGTTLTGLAGDVASFYNLTQDEAYTKLKSVFTGETESLKDLGVVMTQAALDQYALANGFGKTTAKMTEAEKVALRYAFVQNQLATASGDFIRTSGGWANQVRLLKLQFDSLKASIGQGLINALLPVVKVMNMLLGKIQTVASAFSTLTAKVFGKADTSAQAVSSSVEGIGDATATAVGGVENAADAAGKAAKKAASSATSIDELNIVGSSSDSESGGSGGSVGGAITGLDAVKNKTEESIETPMSKALEKIKSLVQEIGDSFEKGFLDRFKDIDFSQLKEGLKGIGSSLKDIFTDSEVQQAAKRFLTTYAEAVGSNMGTALSIGTSIATNITSGINQYLSSNGQFIKDRFVSIFDSGTQFADTTIKFNEFLSELFSVATGPDAVLITSSLVEIFSNSVLGITDLLLKFGADLYDLLVTPVLNNKDEILKAVDETLDPIAKVADKIAGFVTESWEKVFETYEKYIKPAFDKFKNGIDEIIGKALELYEEHFIPVFDGLAEKFSTFVDEYLVPLRDKFLETFGKIIEKLSVLWEEVLVPFITWLMEELAPVISDVIEKAGEIFFTFGGAVSEVIQGALDALLNLVDFIVNVFRGDWDAAWESLKQAFESLWEGIKKAFKLIWDKIVEIVGEKIEAVKTSIETTVGNIKNGVETFLKNIKDGFVNAFQEIKDKVTGFFDGMWDGIKGTINSILSGVESMANGVVRAVNKIINSMNGLSIDVPDWVTDMFGVKSFGFSIPTISEVNIPKLAQGGYVKANTPQLAMIGDNMHQGEIVAPEDKLLEMALSAAKMVNQNNSNEEQLQRIIDLLIKILDAIFGINATAEVDGRTLVTMIQNAKNRSGYELIT
ncbi:MAG: hypothetical protein K0R92_1513 [Lachnospiraceae bacterium]|jgi:phage-related protein|nr:hypothetical protein [Lachnospiraceae bacterium]